MKMRFAFLSSLLFAPLFSIAHAAEFSDVSAAHLYRGEIETLADRAIVKGNPDGTFRPEKTVNRAEMLTLLYRATGKEASAPSKACFKDVPVDAWFAPVVCDAAKQGYVGGYPDGFFRPEKEVNRVEALKMIVAVFRFDLRSVSAAIPTFEDVSPTAWYAPYLQAGFSFGVLPIAGQSGPRFYPDRPLLRGEAAAYIFHALGLTITEQESSESASSSIASSVSTSSVARSETSSSARSVTAIQEVDFPFSDDGVFQGKQQRNYHFSVTKPIVAIFRAKLPSGDNDRITCRLFKLAKETSFALEYYLGHERNGECSIRVALAAGSYQFEVTPKKPDSAFTVFTNLSSGDGNDGFSQAVTLAKNTPKVGALDTEDHADWYTFKIASKQMLTIEVTNADLIRCIIYPMGDVDIYGFSGPECNTLYEFPAGTYVIGVQQRDGHLEKPSFSIRYK